MDRMIKCRIVLVDIVVDCKDYENWNYNKKFCKYKKNIIL